MAARRQEIWFVYLGLNFDHQQWRKVDGVEMGC